MPATGEENLDPIFWRYSRLIEKQVGKNGILECTFMDHVYSEKVITAITEDDIVTPSDNKIPVGAATFGFLMDCPLLLDSDPDNVGFYDVLAGTQVTWPGVAPLRGGCLSQRRLARGPGSPESQGRHNEGPSER